MNILIDIAAVVIILLCVVWGAKKGFVKSVMGLVSLVIAIVVAVNFYPFAASLIKDNVIEPYFVDKTSSQFSSLMNAGDSIVSPEQIFEEKPEELVNTTNTFGQSVDSLKKFYEENIKDFFASDDLEGISNKLSEFLVSNTVDITSNVLGFVVIFVLALICLFLVQLLLEVIFKLPILKSANKLLGAVLGLIKGFVLVVILINVLYVLANSKTDNSKILNADFVKNTYTYTTVDAVNLIF